jgi:hypothetical protein
MTAVPSSRLDYLSTWPTGQPYPNVSTLNSPFGTVLANAAIVASGTGGGIQVLAAQATELIVDTNGYFAPPGGGELLFYPLPPCRLVDTRSGQGKSGAFGPPRLLANTGRDIPMRSNCGIPSQAEAYLVNMTVVPVGTLAYFSAWPAGRAFPGVSTLNSSDGSIIANAAIVPAGANGAITVLASNLTDLIVDVNGYFAPPAAGGLRFYPLRPCRLADTRFSQETSGVFGPPQLFGYSTRDFAVRQTSCSVSDSAQALSLNVTAVPDGPLGFLSLWPGGQAFPGVSTLNSQRGLTIANAAIVSPGTDGTIRAMSSNGTQLILDINGYFAP